MIFYRILVSKLGWYLAEWSDEWKTGWAVRLCGKWLMALTQPMSCLLWISSGCNQGPTLSDVFTDMQEKEVKHTPTKFSNLVKSKRVANALEGRAALESRNLTFNKAKCLVLLLKRTNPNDGTGWVLMSWRARLGGPGSGGLHEHNNQQITSDHSIHSALLMPHWQYWAQFWCSSIREISINWGKLKGMVRARAIDPWGKAEQYGLVQPGEEGLQQNLTGAPTRRSLRREGVFSIEIYGRKTHNSGYKLGQRLVWQDTQGKFSERIMPREPVLFPSLEGLKPTWVKALSHSAWIPSWHVFEHCIALDLPRFLASWIILRLILKNRKYNIPKCWTDSIYYSFNGSSTSPILHLFKGSCSYWIRIQDETVIGRKKVLNTGYKWEYWDTVHSQLSLYFVPFLV